MKITQEARIAFGVSLLTIATLLTHEFWPASVHVNSPLFGVAFRFLVPFFVVFSAMIGMQALKASKEKANIILVSLAFIIDGASFICFMMILFSQVAG